MKYYLQTPLKNLSFLFLFLFCTSSLVRAQNNYTLGDNDVEVDESGVITGCICEFTNKDIIIPKTIGNKTITGIGSRAFSEKDLTSLDLSALSNLTSIGVAAFYSNDLTEVKFPARLTTIGGGAFMYNDLTEVTFPENSSLTTIGEWAFYENYLSSVTFPASLTTIENRAFYNNDLTSVTFPASLTTIGNDAFYYNKLETVSFSEPSNIQSIGADAFSGNSSLTVIGIKLPAFPKDSEYNVYIAGPRYGNNEQKYYPGDDFPSAKFGWSLQADSEECYTLRSRDLTINTQGVITECSYSFANKCIIIPENIDKNEETITITGIADRTYPEKGVFEEKGITSVSFPVSWTTIGERAFVRNDLTSLDLSALSSLTTIKHGVFYDNEIESVIFPASLTSIGTNAFYDNALTSVTFPDESSLASIGSEAFSDNSSLTEIKLPTFPEDSKHNVYIATSGSSEQKYYPGDDFPRAKFSWSLEANREECYTLRNRDLTVNDQGVITECSYGFANKSICIPNDINGVIITGIAGRAAYGGGIFENKGLISVTFPESLETIGERAFGNNALNSVTFPASLTTIGDWAFYANYNLRSLDLSALSRLTTIGEWAFYANINLRSLDLSALSSLTTIGDWAFYANYNLRSLDLSALSRLTTIGEWAFYSNNSLTSVTFPTSLTTIGKGAFKYNALTSVTFPTSLTTIGKMAFEDNALTSVTFPNNSSLTSIGSNAFIDNSSLAPITLPTNSNEEFTVYLDSDGEEYVPSDDFEQFSRSLEASTDCHEFTDGELTINTQGVITACSYGFANKCIIIPEMINEVTITGIAGETAIGTEGIFEKKGITSVTFLANLNTIGARAFLGNSLTSLDLPASLKTIGVVAFISNSLTSVVFPNNSSLTSIEKYAFENNSLHTGITLPTFADSRYNVYIAKSGNNEQKYLPGQDFPSDKFGWSLEASFSWEECFTLAPEDLTILDGVITDCSYDFANKCIIIPSTYIDDNGQEQDITGIAGRNAYGKGIFENKGLISVEFPAGLKTIGERAFAYNQFTALDLSSLNNLDTIAKKAFYNESEENAKISELTLPSSKLTAIGESAFFDNDLISLDLPASLTTIGNDAFSNNELETVSFFEPSNIQRIGARAFSSNSSLLTKITLPNNLNDEFTVYLDSDGVEYAPSDDFKVFRRSLEASIDCHKLTSDELTVNDQGVITDCSYNFTNKSICVPNMINGVTITGIAGRTVVGEGIFKNKSLISVTFPASLETIEEFTFSNNELETVSFSEPSNIQSIGADAFSGNSSLTGIGIKLPAHLNERFIDYEDSDGHKYDSGEDFTEFSSSLWANIEECYTLAPEDLTISDGVITDCSYDFANKCIIIPSTYIDDNGQEQDITGIAGRIEHRKGIFENKGLISVEFPASLKTIGERAFAYNQFTALDLSSLNNLDTIAKKAFYNESEENAKISELTLPSSKLTAIGDYAFSYNDLTLVTLPASLTTIGNDAFSNNELETVSFFEPSNIQRIGARAFSSNSSLLTKITLPNNLNDEFTVYLDSDGVEYAPSDDFKVFRRSLEASIDCHKLTSDELTVNDQGVITDCSYNFTNKSICVPNMINGVTITGIAGRTVVGEGIFENKSLISVTFPASLETIEEFTFSNNELETVSFSEPSNIQSIGADAFSGNSSLTGIGIKLPAHLNERFIDYEDSDGHKYDSGEDFTEFSSSLWANIEECYTLSYDDLTILDGVITDCSYDFANKCIIIPSTYIDDNGQEQDITGIAGRIEHRKGIFENKGLNSVEFPASLKTIGERAFAYNQFTALDLSSLNNLDTIAKKAFYNESEENAKISELTLPSSKLTAIGDYAFSYNDLTLVTLPASLTTIGNDAFSNNELEAVSFFEPSNIQRIGARAFSSNSSLLTKITLPNNLNDEFTVYLDSDGVEYAPSDDFKVFRRSLEASIDCHKLTSDELTVNDQGVITDCSYNFTNKSICVHNMINGVTITGIAGRTVVGEGIFENKSLISVTFPASLETIEEFTFSNNELETVSFSEPSNIQSIGADAFSGNSSLTGIGIKLPAHLNERFIDYEDSDGHKYDSGEDFTEFSSSLWANIEECYTLSYDDLTILDGVITDCSYDFANKCIIIPSTYIDDNGQEQDITGIAGRIEHRKGIFENKGLNSVEFPASLKTIGERAFAYNQFTALDLSSLNNLDTIAKKAFYNESEENAKISELTLPSSKLTAIGDYAFSYNDLTLVTLPASLTTIGNDAFSNNELETVSFFEPSNIQRIGARAFSSNSSLLTKITLPNNLNDEFTVYLDSDGVEYAPSDDFKVFRRSLEASIDCHKLTSDELTVNDQGVITDCSYNFTNKSICVPNMINGVTITGIAGRTVVGEGIFENKSLISVTFPASLETIEEFTFSNNELETVSFSEPSNIQSIGADAFSSNPSLLTKITLPAFEDSRYNVYIARRDGDNEQKYYPNDDFPSDKFGWSLEANLEECYTLRNRDLTVNDQGVITACSYDFANKCIIIPSTYIDDDGEQQDIAGIAGRVFQSKDLTSVTFPASLTTIREWAFYSNDLTSLDLPASLTTIGYYAFSNNDLTSLDLSTLSNLTSIGNYTFFNNDLTSLDLPASLTTIGERAFSNNGLTSLDLPASLTTIGNYTFSNNGLTSLDLPASLTTIGDWAFSNNDLTSLDLPASLTTIGNYTFFDNDLISLDLPASLTTIEDWAFYRNKLEEVKFELDEDGKSSIQSIGNYAFNGNNNLSSITLPDNNNENFQRYIDSRGKTYEVGDSFDKFNNISYSIVTSDPSSSRMAIYDASHSDVEILEQPQPFTYYPNPVVSQLTVTANVGDRILMLNQVGVTVYDKVVTSVVAHQIDVTDFPSGVYLIRLISAEGSVITKRLAKH